MIELKVFFFMIYTTAFVFSIILSILDRSKFFYFIQNTILSAIFLTLLTISIDNVLGLNSIVPKTVLTILIFLMSIVPNLKITEYLSNKKQHKSKSNKALEKTILTFPAVLLLALLVHTILKGTDVKTVLIASIINSLFILVILSTLTINRKITTIKLLEEVIIPIITLIVSFLLTKENKNELLSSLPLLTIPILYTSTSLISPFSVNQKIKKKIFSIFVLLTILVLPATFLLTISSLFYNNNQILIITTTLIWLISILSSSMVLNSIRKVLDNTLSFLIGNFFKNITKEEEIVSPTISSIVNKTHFSISKFLGKNTIELYSFNNSIKTLNLLLVIDGEKGTIQKPKSIKISEEELNKILTKSHKFFTPKTGTLEIFKELESDVIIPIQYEYNLKFLISINIEDKIEFNDSVISFLSNVFHLLILETLAIITIGIAQKGQHNAIVFLKNLNIRQEITTLLIIENFNTFAVNTYNEAIKLIDKINIDLIICDNEIDDKSGINLIKQIKSDPFKNSIFSVMGFYTNSESNTKEFLESLADLQITLKDDFFFLSNIISYITHNLLTKKRIENTFKNVSTINYHSATLLNKILNLKTFSFEEIELEIVSKTFKESGTNVPDFVLIGKINHSFIESKIFASISEKQIILLGVANIPINFFSRQKFGKNKTIFSDFTTEGLSPVEFSKLFAKEILNIVNSIYNFLAISYEDTVLIGINFHSKISLWDIDFMKSLLTNYLLMKVIYEEIREIDNAFIYTMQSLARAAEEMDEETGLHIYRIGEYSKLLSKYIGFNEEFCNSIYYASQMHDIGKLKIPREILRKPGILTPEEYEIMKEHTIAGAIILGDHEKLRMARDIALSHHEKWDGSGYPYGLEKDKIPISARITAIADVYDALRSPRTYKPEFEHERALKIITEGNGRTKPQHFDPDLLKAFKELSDKFNEIYEKYKH